MPALVVVTSAFRLGLVMIVWLLALIPAALAALAVGVLKAFARAPQLDRRAAGGGRLA